MLQALKGELPAQVDNLPLPEYLQQEEATGLKRPQKSSSQLPTKLSCFHEQYTGLRVLNIWIPEMVRASPARSTSPTQRKSKKTRFKSKTLLTHNGTDNPSDTSSNGKATTTPKTPGNIFKICYNFASSSTNSIGFIRMPHAPNSLLVLGIFDTFQTHDSTRKEEVLKAAVRRRVLP
ncbi:hypothetical protein FRB94_006450 [Tulasnella sp. JGI-2019a]|nr:hypothetical protein FRB94_006450 [Tulasnella sp. JGI-2019a]